jgi:hypothetical protein
VIFFDHECLALSEIEEDNTPRTQQSINTAVRLGDVMTRDNREKLTHNEDSLAPIQLDRLSVEETSLIKHRERYSQLAGITAIVGCLVAGGAFVMKQLDAQAAITQTAAAAQRLRSDSLEPFLYCALPGMTRAQLASKEQLMAAIDDVSAARGCHASAHVDPSANRAACRPRGAA